MRRFDRRRDSLMNDQSAGAMRRSASSGRHARRPRQAVRVGDRVEPLAHLELGIVAPVVRAIRAPAEQRRDGDAREIVGVDVVRVHVVLGNERGRPLLQPLERQPGSPRRSRRAHDRQRDATVRGPRAQAILGVDATLRARGHSASRPRLVDARARAIAVHARRRNVDEAPWYPACRRQRGDQAPGAQVAATLGLRRREVHHGVGREAQSARACAARRGRLRPGRRRASEASRRRRRGA
jgi:hypothetical protein